MRRVDHFDGEHVSPGQGEEAPRDAPHVLNEAVLDAVTDEIEETDVSRGRPQLSQEARTLRAARIESAKGQGRKDLGLNGDSRCELLDDG
jgi:hypothetical protein